MAADEDKTKAGKPGGGAAGERRSGRDRRQRPPVTIDLKAERAAAEKVEVPSPPKEAEGSAAEAVAAEPAPPPPPPKPEPRPPRPAPPAGNGWTRIALAGAVGGVVAVVFVLLLQATGLLPAPGGTAVSQAIERAEAVTGTVAALERRVTAVEAMTADLPSIRSAVEGLASRVAALESDVGSRAPRAEVEALAGEVAAVGDRLDSAPPAASQGDLAALDARLDRLEAMPLATPGDADATGAVAGRLGAAETDLAALAERIDALEARLAEGGAANGETARAVALASLRRAATGGQPFAAELDMAAAMGLAGEQVAALRAFAAAGVPTGDQLAERFPPVADAILAATSGTDPEAGLLDRLAGGMRGLVSIRPAGPRPGDDPPAVVSRMAAAVERGDLAAALDERQGLPAAGQDASAEWAARAGDRVALDRLVAEIAQPATPAPTVPGAPAAAPGG